MFQILLFPEGTNISENTKAKSHSFADKNGLKRYEHVLHPRTTGFSFLVEYMKSSTKNMRTHIKYLVEWI